MVQELVTSTQSRYGDSSIGIPLGPSTLFDKEELRDKSTLKTRVMRDEWIDSQARPGKKVRVIHLSFTSQTWHGFAFNHNARIYVPIKCIDRPVAAIMGTKRDFFEHPGDDGFIGTTGLRTEAEYAEGTALDLGIPVMMFSVPGEDIGGMHESDLMGYAMKKLQETGDFTWYCYYPLAKAYLRAITVFETIPGLCVDRVLLSGESKRAIAISIGIGVDPERVAGAWCSCYSGGNNLYSIAMKFAQFGPDIVGMEQKRTGPWYQSASALLRDINNPIGLTTLLLFDPYVWQDQIKCPVMVTLGTNDEFFVLGTANEMISRFSGDKAFLSVANCAHTWVSTKHLAAWRMWVAHVFHGRGIPDLEIQKDQTESKLRVKAKLESQTTIESVRFYFAYNPSEDWRLAKWHSLVMEYSDSCYVKEIDRKKGTNIACYVEVLDRDQTGIGYISSQILRA